MGSSSPGLASSRGGGFIMARVKRAPLLLLVGLVALLVLLAGWSLRSRAASDPFRLEQAVVCLELDDDLKPLRVSDRFPRGTRQVCLWFRYASAREGDGLSVRWFHEGGLIQRETMRLAPGRGTKAFYLLREDGSPLPQGTYQVRLEGNGRSLSVLMFRILP